MSDVPSRLFLLTTCFLFFSLAVAAPPSPAVPGGGETLPVMLDLGEFGVPALAGDGPMRITADAAVLMDAGTGQVLYAKNAHQPRPPASTTKILTALLALEGGVPDQLVTVSPRAAAVGESSMGLFPHQRLTLRQLVYGALLCSGNDACVAIAEHLAGSEENFVWLMNGKARELGATRTSFRNPHGLPAPGHVSTAYDLALLARYALSNPAFREIVSTRYHAFTCPPWGVYHLHNTNRLLWSYPGADGVKTGTTGEAGQCLVASASCGGRRLISVVLHSEDRYGDTVALLNYGFGAFKEDTVVEAGQVCGQAEVSFGVAPRVSLVSARTLKAVLPARGGAGAEKRVFSPGGLVAPVPPKMPAGHLEVWVGGQPVARALLLTASQVKKKPFYRLWWEGIKDFGRRQRIETRHVFSRMGVQGICTRQ
ncbi:D-alanyl-D-alanine carboxypeptidase family protein [Desulfovirgula thermocuniculi]|uniref:D-alanyl-D-alanine carboxypeptidase family protein n=1 Tax=Desulfovirgula thermocuniculi TaxID=348842 RepID=UPI001B7FEE45|nr:D-alanyl-D-alanine carboxypeptidase family protein [Desulfovirgula thermocuniculi]